MGIELTDEQVFLTMELEHWFHSCDSSQLYEITGPAGSGKAQPIDTIIPTPNGNRTLGELKIGDYVFNRCGKPVKVLGIYDQGKKEVYKVTFDDRRSTLCSKEHLWTYVTSKNNLKTVELQDMIGNLTSTDKRGHLVRRYQIPTNEEIEFDEIEYDIDPYMMGLFLGNGCCLEKSLTISSNDIETVEYVRDSLGSPEYIKNSEFNYSYTFRLPHPCGKLKNFQTKDVFKKYPDVIGYAHEKRIPYIYMYGSIEQRWELIHGLFDTDGYIVDNYRANISYSSTSKGLIEDIQFVLHTLGVQSSVLEDIRNGRRVCYSLYVRVDNCDKPKFFKLKRKRDIAIKYKDVKRHRDYSKTYITNIENLGYKTEMRCIYVDDYEHLYLTNDFIVTHNTSVVRYFVEKMGLKNDEVLYVAFTGKAANQLAKHGLPAKTIHSAIYEYVEEFKTDEHGRILRYSNGRPKMKHVFVLKDRLPKKIKLIVVDEGSMVGEKLAKDLMSFGIPMVILGDLNQLPPVMDKQFFLNNPDFRLTKIMRQCEGNPIIYLSQRVINGEPLNYGMYGNSAIIRKSDLDLFNFKTSDIVLTVTNKLKNHINDMYRTEIKRYTNLDKPHVGEKVICVKNNWDKEIKGLFLTNGTCGYISEVDKYSFDGISINISMVPDFAPKSEFRDLEIDYLLLNRIDPDTLSDKKRISYNYKEKLYDKFEYGYAITTHKSQGDQYNNVLFMDEDILPDKNFKKKLEYTAITRAINQIIIVK